MRPPASPGDREAVPARPPIAFELASRRPPLAPPYGRPLVVHVVVNVELWRFDRPMPRALIPAPHGAGGVPDIPNFSWVEYGLRSGMPRILEALAGLPVSVSFNAGVADAFPDLTAEIVAAGWEFVAHGVEQRSLLGVPDERAEIEQALRRIEQVAGHRPRGWLGPGLQESVRTPDLLAELGVEYVCDWAVDDLPVVIRTASGPLVALPYALELNDSVMFAAHQLPSAEYERRVVNTIEAFERELEHQVRVLTLPLHPHLMGVPHRIGHLRRVLEMLSARRDTVFLTGGQITDWYMAADAAAGA